MYPLQQQLREGAKMLRYIYTVYLIYSALPLCGEKSKAIYFPGREMKFYRIGSLLHIAGFFKNLSPANSEGLLQALQRILSDVLADTHSDGQETHSP
jgi:hypothetical protein